jgi:hypothetical protein
MRFLKKLLLRGSSNRTLSTAEGFHAIKTMGPDEFEAQRKTAVARQLGEQFKQQQAQAIADSVERQLAEDKQPANQNFGPHYLNTNHLPAP